MIEIAEELIESMGGGQIPVFITEMVFAELAGGVAQGFKQLGDGDILGLKADIGARHTDFGQTGAVRALPGDKGRPAGRTTLLAVVIRKAHPFAGDPVDVGRAVAHQTVGVTTQVGDTDIIAPDDENVGFFLFGHSLPPLL